MTDDNHPAVPASPTVPPPPPGSGGSGIPTWLLVTVIVVPIAVILLACAGIFTAILLPAISRARQAAQGASCASNLKLIGVICKMYANEHDGYYPPLAAEAGRLMFEPGSVFPEYMSDPSILVCPSDSNARPMSYSGLGLLDDQSYIYLGYMMKTEQEGLAFIDAYREHIAQGKSFEADIEVPPGKGPGGGAAFLRLREGTERLFVGDTSAITIGQSQVPVMFDRLNNHVLLGVNVLYMDGHVEYVNMGEKFPMTPAFLEALDRLEREYEAGAPAKAGP